MLLHFLVAVSAFVIGAPLAIIVGDYFSAFLCIAVGSLWIITIPHEF